MNKITAENPTKNTTHRTMSNTTTHKFGSTRAGVLALIVTSAHAGPKQNGNMTMLQSATSRSSSWSVAGVLLLVQILIVSTLSAVGSTSFSDGLEGSTISSVGLSAQANFTVFNGDITVQALWRASAGATVLEDFESFTNGTQIQSLPALHLTFDQLAGGGYPQAYLFGGTPHGPMHLGNFPNGINQINRWNDIVVRPTPGFALYSMGFWNGDGQSDTLIAFAYDSSGNLLGSVGAFKGTFAGFVSDTPVASVKFEGDTGDGWNHLDGLQVNAAPEPSSLLLMIVGGAMLTLTVRNRKPKQEALANAFVPETRAI